MILFTPLPPSSPAAWVRPSGTACLRRRKRSWASRTPCPCTAAATRDPFLSGGRPGSWSRTQAPPRSPPHPPDRWCHSPPGSSKPPAPLRGVVQAPVRGLPVQLLQFLEAPQGRVPADSAVVGHGGVVAVEQRHHRAPPALALGHRDLTEVRHHFPP